MLKFVAVSQSNCTGVEVHLTSHDVMPSKIHIYGLRIGGKRERKRGGGGGGARCESETNSNTLKSCMHIRSARLTLNVVRYNIHSCTIDVIVHTCRCPQQIPSTRDYHPGHQQRDLSQGGEEVEVNPTSTTPNHQHLHVLCVGVSV